MSLIIDHFNISLEVVVWKGLDWLIKLFGCHFETTQITFKLILNNIITCALIAFTKRLNGPTLSTNSNIIFKILTLIPNFSSLKT